MNKFRKKIVQPFFLTSFNKAGYGYYNEYLKSEDFRERRNDYKARHPNRYYCYVCDCKGSLDWHHENYENIPKETSKDMIWLCGDRCRCGRHCHQTVHFDEYDEKIPMKPWHLAERKRQLRKAFVWRYYIWGFRWKSLISAWVLRVLYQPNRF